jgi:hypothetical protein
MRNVTLEYISAVAVELANLAETSGHPSLAVLFRKASVEAKVLQDLQNADSACSGRRRRTAGMPTDPDACT